MDELIIDDFYKDLEDLKKEIEEAEQDEQQER